MPQTTVRLGLVGAGRIAQAAHLPAAVKASGIELVAVSDPNDYIVNGVADKYGIAGYRNFEDLLAGDVDAVIVAAPDRLHVPLATQAIDAGKHVLVEKPLATTEQEALELTDLAATAGVKLQVGSMKRHDPGIEFARSCRDQVGNILSVQAWYRVMSRLRPDTEETLFPSIVMDPAVRAAESTFKTDRERYLLVTHGAHLFDEIRYLAGDLTSISARLAAVGEDITWHGTGALASSGGLVSFEISANVHSDWSEGFSIFGDRGTLQIQSHFPFFRRASDVTLFTEHDGISKSPSRGDSNAFKRQLEAFAVAIVKDEDPNPNGLDGAAAAKMLQAVATSTANNGREVAL
jgi:predicted dehydrogenase